ncbi:MAG: hypothetical protein EAZ25_16155 [Oscillatoriales cyanobacterium]|nr:MAG: hypothetical protein EAZ25_16155 [Oscillatoriales cyanobacterium]
MDFGLSNGKKFMPNNKRCFLSIKIFGGISDLLRHFQFKIKVAHYLKLNIISPARPKPAVPSA